MKQWKEILMIAMTAAVILLCGQFPELLAKDRKEDTPHYREVSQIAYDLSAQQEELPFEKKLLLLEKRRLSIPETDVVLTPEQVLSAVYDGLQPYVEHNLIPPGYSLYDFSCQSFLCYDPEDPEVNNRAWNVTMSYFPDGVREPSALMGVILDDATGTILQFSFHAAGAFIDRPVSSEVGVLSSVYLNSIPVTAQNLRSISDEDRGIQHYGLYPKGIIEFLLHRDGFEILIDPDANWMQEP